MKFRTRGESEGAINIRIPRELRRQFKTVCSSAEKSMALRLTELMQQDVREHRDDLDRLEERQRSAREAYRLEERQRSAREAL